MAKPSLKSGATTSSFARHSTKPGQRSTLHAVGSLAGHAARPKRARVDSALFGDAAFHAGRVATIFGY
jgi:hypothetical protein